jgi:hypothetical protein
MGKLEITERDKKIMEILKKVSYLREDILSKYLGLEYNSKKTKDIFITNKQKSENFKTVIF